MVKISLKYEGDLGFAAMHGPSGVTLKTDAPVDNQGKGSSFSPTDLVATALGACMGTIIGIVARRDNLDVEGMTVNVEKEMTKTTPRRIDSLKVEIRIPKILREEDKKKLHNAAITCPVQHSIHPDIKVTVDFKWGLN